jgi:hypothetical protein
MLASASTAMSCARRWSARFLRYSLQRTGGDRTWQKIHGAERIDPVEQLWSGIGGADEKERKVARALGGAQLFRELKTVDFRHADIQNRDRQFVLARQS